MHEAGKIDWGLFARRLGVYVAVAVAAALLWTWADTGTLFGGGDWTEGLFARAVPLAMIAVTVAVQRLSLLAGIVVGIVCAFGAILLFEGAMASWYWIGEFFLKALKMIIVPLIIFAMISGITALGDVRKLGRLGSRTIFYYAMTTLVAVVIGTILVNIVQPGDGFPVPQDLKMPDSVAGKGDTGIADIVMSFVHDNILGAMAELKMLPIIVFSLIFGAVVTTVGQAGRGVIDFCHGANEVMMKIVHIIMLLAPVGIFALVAGKFGAALEANGTEAFLDSLGQLGKYAGTVIGGLAIHGFIVLPLLLWVLTKRSPFAYLGGMASALMTAFSTASSAATMPMTLESVEHNNDVDKRAAQFVIPLGATVNMDGTALYEAVAAIFIAQAYGLDLDFGQQVVIVITATLAAIGAAGIPEAGLVTLVMVLEAVGLPTEGIGLILIIDWLLDRFRTTINVWGDSIGAAVMEKHGLSPDADPPDLTETQPAG